MADNKLVDFVVQVFGQLRAAAKAYWRRRAAVGEIERLGPQETTCLAKDLGISVDDIRILAGKDERSADLLVRRMETLGLDPARIDPKVMRDLQRGCSKCNNKGLCVHELEDKPRDPTWPKYCPNEQTLDALTEERAPNP